MGVHNIATGQEIEPAFEPQEPPAGGSGGSMDGVEARIVNLENFAVETKERLTRVETKLDHIEKEISNAKWFVLGGVLTIVVTVIATVIGTGVGIQQMTVTTFEAAARANASGNALLQVEPGADVPSATSKAKQ